MIDASKGFRKDGPKNRLREQDIHRIVDIYIRQIEVPGYSRMVPLSEISDSKNEYSLNLSRYIESTDSEDIQNIEGHLKGGIPNDDVDAFKPFWDTLPSLRIALFEQLRPGFSELKVPASEITVTITKHSEFLDFNNKVTTHFEKWKHDSIQLLKKFEIGDNPKNLIEKISETLLINLKQAPLIVGYDIYQIIMDYWGESMQDDCYLIASSGWVDAARPREIFQIKKKDGKNAWAEAHEFSKGKRRFKSDLLPASILIENYFIKERNEIKGIESEQINVENALQEIFDENSGDEGLLIEVIEGDGDKQKITAKGIKARLKEIKDDPDEVDEQNVLMAYAKLLERQGDLKIRLKVAYEDLDAKIESKYFKLTENEIRDLVVDCKWIKTISTGLQGELNRISQMLTNRIRDLAERYATPLSSLTDQLKNLSVRVDKHLHKMGME